MNGWNGVCHRCLKPSPSFIQSMYNKALICGPCKKDERAHPDYKRWEYADLMGLADRVAADGHLRQAAHIKRQAERLLSAEE